MRHPGYAQARNLFISVAVIENGAVRRCRSCASPAETATLRVLPRVVAAIAMSTPAEYRDPWLTAVLELHRTSITISVCCERYVVSRIVEAPGGRLGECGSSETMYAGF